MNRKTWLIVGVVTVLVTVGALVLAANAYYYYYYSNYYGGVPYSGPWGMMSWMWGYWSGYVHPVGINAPGYVNPTTGYASFTIPISKAVNLSMSTPSYVHVYRSNNTIVFTSSDITLVALAMMGDDAVNMTGMPLPGYAHGDVFVIYGLINPTLVIPQGAVVHVIVINLDDDMYHNLIVTAVPPPYPYNVMPYVGMYGGYMGPGMMTMMQWLPPANYNAGYAYGYEYTITLNAPGTYWYLCTYPGHAQDGMYGEVIVTGDAGYQGSVNSNVNAYYGYPGMGPGMMGW
ncbi:plastocyanin/azurin family copper-binding protein [Caldivirga maquilingensis]|uniref:Blue (type 1) copper domain-containing protein n=1 Tax=Caldivirga maquilingensis (strain ATCC 700844 / DSM 13496 / JCM 10307 / IC-167) TaxID=397948 RepID=A8M988_CALMQ|nr:plastocyanin/azurin family copper-binding protein [Caldivirga maquilingensis]ABW02307.1 hypothetical protein Cmaq_1483 [Caldivirga maquilingensis IC-167]